MEKTLLILLVVLLVGLQQAVCDTGAACKDDCIGLANGDYQSCDTCSAYHTCSNSALTPNRPCPTGLVWDDTRKRCKYTSSTCTEPVATTGSNCVTDCWGLADGRYQHCDRCVMYVSCSFLGKNDVPCLGSQVWDDQKKMCSPTSATCVSEGTEQQQVRFLGLDSSSGRFALISVNLLPPQSGCSGHD